MSEFEKKLTQLIADDVQLVASDFQGNAMLVECQSMLVNRFDTFDDFFDCCLVRVVLGGRRFDRNLFCQISDVVKLNQTWALY